MVREVQELTQKDVLLHSFFDFGKDAFGTLEIELTTSFPANVEVVIGEIARDGKIIHTAGYRTFIQKVIQTGSGHQVIRIDIPKFIPAFGGFPHCHAPAEAGGEIAPFRYVEVNRTYGDITVRRTAFFNNWDDNASDFNSSDPDLNKIWEFCKYSIKAATVFDKYVDGERERLPYEGDAVINQLGHFCSGTDFKIARRTIDHFFEFGKFTWPVEWLLLTPMLIRDYIFYSGDTAILQKYLPLLEEKLLLDCRDENGLLNRTVYKTARPGSRLNDLIDWPMSERDNYVVGDVNFVPNAYLYGMLNILAGLTGNEKYSALAETLRSAIRQHLLKSGRFVDSSGSEHTSLHTAVFALAFDLAEGEEIEFCRQLILEKEMACSVYAAQFLLEVCFRCGMADHGVKLMTSKSDRSWFNMLREGATITMESWGDKWKPNQDWNHAWGAAPANIIPRMLAGIRPAAPGFARFTVDPRPGTLESFTLRHPTIHGEIKLLWSKEKKVLTVPENTQALYKGKTLPPGTHELD